MDVFEIRYLSHASHSAHQIFRRLKAWSSERYMDLNRLEAFLDRWVYKEKNRLL